MAVIIVMLLVAVFSLLVASLMSNSNIGAITDMQAQQAFYLAHAGLEWYLERLQGDNNWSSPPAVKTNEPFGAGTFSVSESNHSRNQIDVTATGKVTGWDGNTVQRVIRCHVDRPIAISQWREIL